MDDVVGRLLLVAAVAAAALTAGWLATRRSSRRAERAPIDAGGFSGRVLLFTDAACGSCDQARSVLEATGAPFTEVRYGEHPEGMRRAGIAAVPLILVRDEAGDVVGRVAGRPSVRRVRRLLARAGIR
jgi:hypothetical protein